MTKNATNKKFKTLENAMSELGFGNYDLDELRQEELISLYNHYYQYLKQIDKKTEDDQYKKSLNTMEKIINELTDRCAMYEYWHEKRINGNEDLDYWNRTVQIAIESLNKLNAHLT